MKVIIYTNNSYNYSMVSKSLLKNIPKRSNNKSLNANYITDQNIEKKNENYYNNLKLLFSF